MVFRVTERLKSEADRGIVSNDRVETLNGVLEEFGRILSADDKDIPALIDKGQRIQEFIKGKFEMLHYLSHGIKRPPVGSRAADLACLIRQR